MSKITREIFEKTSYLSDNNAAFIEALYEDYLENPANVPDHWCAYFQSLQNGALSQDVSHRAIREVLEQSAQRPKYLMAPASQVTVSEKQTAVDALIEAYRRFGHLNAKLDPLGTTPGSDPRLGLGHYQLSDTDLATQFNTRGLLSQAVASLSDIIEALKTIYCGTIGVEYSTISNEEERMWMRAYVEQQLPLRQGDHKVKLNILQQLIHAEALEKYLDAKYVGQKRFSIEGADSLIPMMDELTQRARRQGLHEVVIGMAHRGRLNMLLNIMGQSPAELFQEFEGKKDYGLTSGDVKYHRGYSRDVLTESGPIHLALAFNPSHLEFICPVIMGSTRARQDRQTQVENKLDYALAVMIHGDAAFSGLGVVMETLSMSATRGYSVGGAIHIVLNNQIGFTTSNVLDARSSYYCTDLAKMLDAPILHVNADDPEGVVSVMQLALDFRMRFHKDIFIDLVGYRRHGHQEVDEPTATQPIMYQRIKSHATALTLYAQQLIAEKVCTEQQISEWTEAYRARLDQGRQIVETLPQSLCQHYAENWTPYLHQTASMLADTSVPMEKLTDLAKGIATYPSHFKLQRQVGQLMAARQKMAEGQLPLDWGFAESLAYATLADEGYSIRISGEDVRRGTFYHRHAVLWDQPTGEEYCPLKSNNKGKSRIEIYDSLLAETGPMGFEYGYASAEPRALVIWEAQFGDFANSAQVIIDQFISSGWQKWNRLSGVTLFLPHGLEGMGPEHSSARLERFLQLAAQENIQVCVPTTPAQIFHLLRRQMIRPVRKPLIVMTPKSLLRHKLAVSSLGELAHGQFQLLIPEIEALDTEKVTRVVLCSGKVYYELLEKRQELNLSHIAIVRIEQLYPFPYDELTTVLKTYPNANKVVWCQEEPKNQGAWFISKHRLLECMRDDQSLMYAGRAPFASPAAGYLALHKKQQAELISKALGIFTAE